MGDVMNTTMIRLGLKEWAKVVCSESYSGSSCGWH